MKELHSQDFDEFIRSNRVAVVDFWAPWCSPCIAMEPALKRIESEERDIAIAKLNVDENPEVAREYGVMSIPTLIVFINGREMDRIIGFLSEDVLRERLSNYSGSLSP